MGIKINEGGNYKDGQQVAGLTILELVEGGAKRHRTYLVRHEIDCGAEYEIKEEGIDRRLTNGIFDFCGKCTQRKNGNLKRIEDRQKGIMIGDRNREEDRDKCGRIERQAIADIDLINEVMPVHKLKPKKKCFYYYTV